MIKRRWQRREGDGCQVGLVPQGSRLRLATSKTVEVNTMVLKERLMNHQKKRESVNMWLFLIKVNYYFSVLVVLDVFRLESSGNEGIVVIDATAGST